MSAVTVTDIDPGTTADIGDVNDTISAWNAATAAGQIGGGNVRAEGIDRRCLDSAAHIVAPSAYPSNVVNRTSTGSGLVRSTGVYAVVPVGEVGTYGTELSTLDYTPTLTQSILVTASVYFETDPLTVASAATLPKITLALQRSVNGGGAWTTIAGSVRRFRMRNVGVLSDRDALGNRIPAICRDCTWTMRDTPSATVRYRVVFLTENDGSVATGSDVAFFNGTIFAEVFA